MYQKSDKRIFSESFLFALNLIINFKSKWVNEHISAMKKTSSKSYSMNNKSESVNYEKESQSNKSFQAKSLSISPLSLNTLTSNATNYMETGPETSSQKHYKGQSSGTHYENQYFKLTNVIRDMFLEMKNRTLRDVNSMFVIY